MTKKEIAEELTRINSILYHAWSGLKMGSPPEVHVHEARCAISDLRTKTESETTSDDQAPLADYIVTWLMRRNGGELDAAFYNMTMRDFENLKAELRLILKHGGKPPNWV